MNQYTIEEVCSIVRAQSAAIHKYLSHGHLRQVYENGLQRRLINDGVWVQQQFPLPVYDEDLTCLGEYYADLYVEECLLVDIQSVPVLTDYEDQRILGYLRASQADAAMLINFGNPQLEIRFLESQRRPAGPDLRG